MGPEYILAGKPQVLKSVPAAEQAEADWNPAVPEGAAAQETEGLLARQTAELSTELQEGLRLLDNSQGLIRTIFLGLAMQYRSLDLQRCQLLAAAEDPEAEFCGVQPRAVQIAASLVTLCALVGFQKQAQDLACETAQEGVCPDLTEIKLSSIVLLVSLIRLFRLANPEQAMDHESAARELENLEELVEPVVE